MSILLAIALILIAAKLSQRLCQKLNCPLVAGELFAGVLLGPSVLNLIQPTHFLLIIADIAIILLLFEAGSETDFNAFKKVGRAGMVVAGAGFILPLTLVYGLSRFIFEVSFWQSLFIAGALTATSIGITVRVLTDLKKRQSHAAHIVIAAAVFDDILGVILLVLLLSFSGSGGGWDSALKTFFILAGFAMGLVLAGHQKFKKKCAVPVHLTVKTFAPVFFIMVGVSVNLQDIAWHSLFIWAFSFSLFILAVLTKFIAGFTVKEQRFQQIIIGLSMIPRGEVGLIFAQLGLQSQILNLPEYTALVIVMMATTLMAPFLLRWHFSKAHTSS